MPHHCVPMPAHIKLSWEACENTDVGSQVPRRCCWSRTTLRYAARNQSLHTREGTSEWGVRVWARRLVRVCSGCGWDVHGRPSRARMLQGSQAAWLADTTSVPDKQPCYVGGSRVVTTKPSLFRTTLLTITFWNIPLPSLSRPCPHCLGRYL